MLQLMTHLIANFPDPASFKIALKVMLNAQVKYLEIQLPFSNPVADGPINYEANIKALKHNSDLENVLNSIEAIFKLNRHTTSLVLMSYITPLQHFGFEKLCQRLRDSNFKYLIVPDLTFGTPEYIQLQAFSSKNGLSIIPVLPLNISQNRLNLIKSTLKLNQPIYIMARNGTTGKITELNQLQQQFIDLKSRLQNFDICIGFGIQNANQTKFLNVLNLTPVIGSAITKLISESNQENLGQNLGDFLAKMSAKSLPKI